MLFNALNNFIVSKVVQNNPFLLWAIVALGSTVFAITLSNMDILEEKAELASDGISNWPFEPLPYIPAPSKKIVPVNPAIKTIEVEVASGESLSLIFQKVGLPDVELLKILSINKDSEQLKNLKPGQKIKFEISNNLLNKLFVEITSLVSLIFSRQGLSFSMKREAVKPDTIVVTAGTELETSL